jgi:nucleotide-binding universal stress UspA family protein
MRVVAGIDFSEPSARAADVAARIAARSKGSLLLVHAAPRSSGDQESAAALERASARLDAEAARVAALGAEVDVRISEGDPDEVVADSVQRAKADLAVIGALGRRAGTEWRLGSTAERLARVCTSPVLVVRDSRPFLAWLEGGRPLRILFAADPSPASAAAASFIAALRRVGPCDVVAARLYWPPDERARLGVRGPAALLDHDPELEALVTRDLLGQMRPLMGEGELRARTGISLGRLADHLVSWAEQEQADLLVVGSHRRGPLERLWHGSVSHGVLHLSPLSVLCVPKELAEVPDEVRDIRRVLVPVDFSAAAAAAVRMAVAIATPGKEIVLLHVAGPGGKESADRGAELIAQMRALLPAGVEARVRASVEIAHSAEVPKAILQAAERLDVELVCMGTRGLKGLARALVGSVAEAVLRDSPRPVLLVKPA